MNRTTSTARATVDTGLALLNAVGLLPVAEDLAEGGGQGGGGAAEGWEGLSSLLALLGEAGECSSRPLTLVSNEGSTELLLTRWTPQE